jgi:tRNA G10  N-methylase Trm11
MRGNALPKLPKKFEYRLELRHHVTPRLLKFEPVHRWFFFPHSFSPQLIDEILQSPKLKVGSRILDPFVGAGTTVVRAAQLGFESVGIDLSPLSVFVTGVKKNPLDKRELEEALAFLLAYSPALPWALPERLAKAFTQNELAHFLGMSRRIAQLPPAHGDFFRLVLLRVMQRVSRAVANGGWFRWTQKEDQSGLIKSWFETQALEHIQEVRYQPQAAMARVLTGDARQLGDLKELFDFVVTSPPYPNRHDYSRIFHMELLWLGLEEEQVKQLRKSSLRSHVEALKPKIPYANFTPPPLLEQVLRAIPAGADPRIPRLLKGYFEDLHLVLKGLHQRLRVGGLAAFVVGNVRHAGVMVPVDAILCEIAERLGFTLEEAWVVRLRGNSAQQMGKFGREPARESVLIWRRS